MVFEETGRRSLQFETEAAARRKKAALSRQFERNAPRTLANMLDEYIEEKIDTGRALPYIARAEQRRILFLLGDSVTKDIRHVTATWAAGLYRQLTVKRSAKTKQLLSAASHRCYLDYLKAFFGWAVKRSYVRRSPFADVRPAGKPNRGKPQLRIEEAHRFIKVALQRFTVEQEPLALATLVALYMGLRAGEILKRQVRDLDANGQVLWIDFGKTHNARRHLNVPEVLQAYLLQICQGKGKEDYIFAAHTLNKPRRRQALWEEVRTICHRAEVPVVCTHSLRGLYATLAVESGAVSAAVAASLGHGSFSMTERHYASPGSVMNARTARVASLLPNLQHADQEDELSSLRNLDPKTLARLVSLAQKEELLSAN